MCFALELEYSSRLRAINLHPKRGYQPNKVPELLSGLVQVSGAVSFPEAVLVIRIDRQMPLRPACASHNLCLGFACKFGSEVIAAGFQ